MFCLNEEVDLYFPLVLMVILAADITAGVFLFMNYPSRRKARREKLTIAILIIICAIVAAVIWTLIYFFSAYPKETIYIGIGSE